MLWTCYILPYRDQYTYSCGRQSPVWPVDERAKSAAERPRTNTLAKSKEYHRDYQSERPLPNEVSASARRASSSERLESLSKPKSRVDRQFRDAIWEVSGLIFVTHSKMCDEHFY